MRYFQSQPTVPSRSADGCVQGNVAMTASGILEYFCIFSELSTSLDSGTQCRDLICNWCS